MGVFNNPKFQYYLRIAQFAFAIAFLVVISYAGAHRGWWRNINAALAVGVIATVITFAVTLSGIWVHHRKNPNAGSGKVLFFARLGVEIVVILFWIATVALMLQKKGGCRFRSDRGRDVCSDELAGDRLVIGIDHGDRPRISWALGVVFAFVEIANFILSFGTVLMADRATRAELQDGASVR